MDLEDFFETKRKPYDHHYKEHRDHDHDDDESGHTFNHSKHEYQYSNRHDRKHGFDWRGLLARINSNPLLRVAAIAIVLLAVLLIILLIIVLLPLLSTIWEALTGSGLQGLLDKLLKG